MANTNREQEGIVKATERISRADCLKAHIKQPLEEFRTHLLAGRTLFPSEVTDVVLLVIFTYINLLGYLYKGSDLSKYAVEFIREYLGRIDPRYAEVGGLLYDAFRHGYVHLATPKRIKLRGGEIVDFQFSRAKDRQDHLSNIMRRQEGRVEIHHLSLDVDLLYEDLLCAIDKYAEDIRSYQELSDTFWEAFATRRDPEKAKLAKEAVLLDKKKQYIRSSDFDFVREQISKVQ